MTVWLEKKFLSFPKGIGSDKNYLNSFTLTASVTHEPHNALR